MLNRRAMTLSLGAFAAACAAPRVAQTDVSKRPQGAAALSAMKRAARFMTDNVSYRGGYVWACLPDFSRTWGEMEAYRTMLWVQPPGTGTMGHAFLDAWHATGDEQFLTAARQAARALAAAQHPAGGWNYIFDFAGEESLKRWYATIGANGWRLEEFQRYYGNATFDDAGTSEASQLMLRISLAPGGSEFKAPLEKAIRFVLDSQYANGGWPQRFPFVEHGGLHGRPDYTRHITFNDDVAGENIKFLIMCAQALGDARAEPAVRRAMGCFLATQQPAPQAGWGLQHDAVTLKPKGARTYEPEALVTHTTANNAAQLMTFYELTGDKAYLSRVGEALDWLDKVKLPAGVANERRSHPTFVEIGTDTPLYMHRRGSNVVNGEYYVSRQLEGSIAHYSPTRLIRTAELRARLAKLQASSPEEASRHSPLKAGRQDLPRFFTTEDIEVSDLNSNRGAGEGQAPTEANVGRILGALNADGWWPTPLTATSNPYAGPGSATPAPGDYSTTRVGDASDTSPYITDTPPTGISIGAFVQNMAVLSRYLGETPG